MGERTDAVNDLLRPSDPASLYPQSEDPFEYYSEAYKERRKKSTYARHLEEMYTPFDELLMEKIANILTGRSEEDQPLTKSPRLVAPPARAVEQIPKVGRNAPCPCGSGRKYKQCCLKK